MTDSTSISDCRNVPSETYEVVVQVERDGLSIKIYAMFQPQAAGRSGVNQERVERYLDRLLWR